MNLSYINKKKTFLVEIENYLTFLCGRSTLLKEQKIYINFPLYDAHDTSIIVANFRDAVL